jgi:hypothetical protein
MAYTNYLGTQEAEKELLLFGVGIDGFALLKKQHQVWQCNDPLFDTSPL